MDEHGTRRIAKQHFVFENEIEDAADEGGLSNLAACKRQCIEDLSIEGEHTSVTTPAYPEPDPTEMCRTWRASYRNKWRHLAAENAQKSTGTPLLRQLTASSSNGMWGIGQLLAKFRKQFDAGAWKRAQVYRVALHIKCMQGSSTTSFTKRRSLPRGTRVAFLFDVAEGQPELRERVTARLWQAPSTIFDDRMDRAIAESFEEGTMLRVKALINAGADAAFRRKPGETALHAAAYCGDLTMIISLLGRTEVLSVQDGQGKLPADLAAMRGNGVVLDVLQHDGRHRSARDITLVAHDVYVSNLRENEKTRYAKATFKAAAR